ncbi:MAG: DUF5752 family protein [bacterium]
MNRKESVFTLKDCALLAIATGKKAHNLRELRDRLEVIDEGSIYYHFWGGLLLPRFDDPEYNNDFASWARHGLHDNVMAERFSVLNPADFRDLEEIRRELIELIEERLAECETVPWAKKDNQFNFIRSKIVIFNTDKRIYKPSGLADCLPDMTASSIFYHFIDARRRTEDNADDFTAWLRDFGDEYSHLRGMLGGIDPYFGTLEELKKNLIKVFADFFQKKLEIL